MVITINALVVGKVVENWTSGRTSYVLNLIQNDGEIVDQLHVPETIYAHIERGHEYTFEGIYSKGQNGAYIRVTNASMN